MVRVAPMRCKAYGTAFVPFCLLKNLAGALEQVGGCPFAAALRSFCQPVPEEKTFYTQHTALVALFKCLLQEDVLTVEQLGEPARSAACQ